MKLKLSASPATRERTTAVHSMRPLARRRMRNDVNGGIIIPDTAKEKPQQGKVIAAGNGKMNADGKRVPLDVKAGDVILFGKYTSQEVKLDGEEYLILREDEVLAVMDGAG